MGGFQMLIALIIMLGSTKVDAFLLEGTWCNEKGSKMVLKTGGNDGNDVTGTYRTSVGNADGWYQLRGRRTVNEDGSQVVALAVAWVNTAKGSSHSATAWSGQLQLISGKPTFTAMWLLVRQTKPDDNWQATRVDKVVFNRCE